MATIFEVYRKLAYPGNTQEVCAVGYRDNPLQLPNYAYVPCSTIGQYRVGDTFAPPIKPDVPGAVDELRKAVEDLVLVVREFPSRPGVPGLPFAYQEAIDHLAIVRDKLGVNR